MAEVGREHVINQNIVRLLSTCAEKPDPNARLERKHQKQLPDANLLTR